MSSAPTPAAGAPLDKPAPAARRFHGYDWAREVAEVLTKALARDDERRRHTKRCPMCGHINRVVLS